MTQEKLADYLNISYQSVSKWETGTATPDLSLIVPIARLFNVSTDELLGATTEMMDIRRKELEDEYEATWQTGDLEKRYNTALAAVSEYPGEMKYLDWLAWTEAMRSFSFENDDEYVAEQEKAIKHFACVIENATDEKIKASSIQGIVQYLAFRGRHDEAKSYALLYPENFSVSKDNVLLNCLQGKEKKIHHQKMLDNMLTDILNHIGNYDLLACEAQEKILQALIPDGNYLYYHFFLADNYLRKAFLLTLNSNYDEAVKMLRISHSHAVEYDKFMRENTAYHHTSPFFSEVEFNTANICRTGTTTKEEDFFEAIKRAHFDPLRDREDFKALINP